jgi:hypothetical protein
VTRRLVVIALLLSTTGLLLLAFQFGLTDPEDRVIQYNRSDDLADPVAKLQRQMARSGTTLAFEPSHGYLIAVLRALAIPASSQGLVFSKTSLHADHVSPRTPRAVYFNDNAYVSWAPGAEEMDVTAVDPKKGPIFYTLEQRETFPPHFERRAVCTGCHLGPKTLNVPGHLLRSVITAADGRPLSQMDRFSIGHGSPLDQRWGGWYVTAANDRSKHMGNLVAVGDDPRNFQMIGSLADLDSRIEISRYLSSGSDIVALLVLAHQVKMDNLMTRANYETRYALADQQAAGYPAAPLTDSTKQHIAHVAEPLLEYMLFRDEAPLEGPIEGSSSFTHDFERLGPRDRKGRSLRQLDLRTRLMRYPCSYLIYSEAFDDLPQPLKDYLWRRLAQILSGRDQSAVYAGMAAQDREAVFEILRATKPEFARSLNETSQ